MSDGNDTARVKARLDAGASASEIAKEAYRICRINGYLRRSIQHAKDALRECDQVKKKQAVIGDALDELRDETRKTRGLLERAWGLLEQRNVKIPADMKITYDALKTRDAHDWQARKGLKHGARLMDKNIRKQQQSRKGAKAKDKTKKKKEGEQAIIFLLHTHEGKTHNLRDQIADNNTDEEMDFATADCGHASDLDDLNHSSPATAAPQQGGLTSNNVVAGTKRKIL